MKKGKESFFWTSYSDLMTSLFIIMLVLFVLVIVLLHKRMEATIVEKEQIEKVLEEIKKVEASTRDLEGKYFSYNKEYEKFILNIDCQFPVRQYDINLLDASTRSKLMDAGQQVKDFLDRHSENQYLVIVEGQASANSENWTEYNYNLSFQRALSLIKFWATNPKVKFSDKNCELQIAGSGDGRLSAKTMRESVNEKNQRFLIYIIPKNIIKKEVEQ
jgi:outer membrane protein OmpA-like peptidoglycan-associated protein